MGLKPTFGIRAILAPRRHLCYLWVFIKPMVDPVQKDICEIDSCGERRWQAVER